MINDFEFNESNLEREYDELCLNNGWNILFQKIKNNASFKMMNNECKVSRSEENRFKNKYREIVPYDYNRVLLPRSSYFNSDYINASLVKIDERSYIVTQYPSRTRDLFWLMVWHFKSPGIILLGKFEESESESYFPKTENDLYIKSNDNLKIIFSIKLLEIRTFNGFYQRKLRLFNLETDIYHDLWHFEFWPWPDHRAPKCLFSFLTLMGTFRQLNIPDSPENPAIIHCSAGAGRSGTFCLIDLLILQMEKYHSLDNLKISEIIEELRVQRMGMVHSIFQLKFSYEAIIEAYKRYKTKPNAQLNGSYLLCDQEANINNKSELFSSSSSESAASETVYYQISDEDDESDISDTFQSENLFNNFYEDIIDEFQNESNLNSQQNYTESYDLETCRHQIICRRKLKNQQNIDKLAKHLEESNMQRFRTIPNISSSSTISLFDEINNNYYWSLFAVGGTIFFMGACLWLKYNPFK